MILKNNLKKYLDRVYIYFKRKDRELNQIKKRTFLQKFKTIGTDFKLNGNQHFVSQPKKVIIGNNVHIGNNIYIKSEGGLVIGHNTHISRNVTIYTENHNYKGSALPYDNTTNYKPVIIEDNVWIGMNVSIVPGVQIGEGAVIGMGTVVNRDIEPLEIVGCGKAITIKKRDKVHYDTLVDKNFYGGVNGKTISQIEFTSYFKTYRDQRNKPIVFILGTGRSGTASITDFFNKHEACKAFHEHFHQVTRISSDLAHYKNNEVLLELDSILRTHSWEANDGELLVHTDQRFWNLVPFLNSYFPNAKFIHLIREPYSCIKSMYERGWFTINEYPDLKKHDWAKYRLNGYLVGEFEKDEWLNLSSLEKCTWYYFYLNYSIKNYLSQISKEKVLRMDLEMLTDNKDQLFNFCDLETQSLEIDKKIKALDET